MYFPFFQTNMARTYVFLPKQATPMLLGTLLLMTVGIR